MRKCSSTVNCLELRILRLEGDHQTSLPSFTTTTNQPKQGAGYTSGSHPKLILQTQQDAVASTPCPVSTMKHTYFQIKVFFSFKRKIVEKVLGITYTRDFSYLQNFKKRFLLIGMKVLIITRKPCVRQPPKGPVKIGIIGQVACMQIMMFMYQSDLKHSFWSVSS